MSQCSTDYWEHEFDSLLEATTDKDIDQVHVYENQLEVGEFSTVRSDKYYPISVIESLINDVGT